MASKPAAKVSNSTFDPSKVVVGAELREFIAGASVVTDATAVPSPPPSKGIFQLREGAR